MDTMKLDTCFRFEGYTLLHISLLAKRRNTNPERVPPRRDVAYLSTWVPGNATKSRTSTPPVWAVVRASLPGESMDWEAPNRIGDTRGGRWARERVCGKRCRWRRDSGVAVSSGRIGVRLVVSDGARGGAVAGDRWRWMRSVEGGACGFLRRQSGAMRSRI
jgi:hypothetical protein